MSTRKRQIAATLAGAAALVPGPVAANAAPSPAKAAANARVAAKQRPGSPRRDSGSLARRLGVTDQILRRALEDSRAEVEPSPAETSHASDLGLALGVSRGQAASAIERVRRRQAVSAGPGGRLADGLAHELGLDADHVALALRGLGTRSARQAAGRRAQYAAAVARRLDLPVEDVERALPPAPV